MERRVTEENKYKQTSLREKSKFYPRHMLSKEIEAFDQIITSEIRKEEKKPKRNRPSNLSKEENVALKECDTKELIVKPADKGGGIVILNKERYETEALRLLGDQNVYKILRGDPTVKITNQFFSYLDKGRELDILKEEEHLYLKVKYPRIPVFYYLPKIHKNRANPPGRPIVSGIGSISSRVSEYVDHLLQPVVIQTPSYIKDTMSRLKELEKIIWKHDLILATCDVNSLYTIILHQLGCEAVEHFLKELGKFEEDQIEYLVEGIKLILENNYFWYGGQYYLQLTGMAMGTRFAPSYANLFMLYWEHQMVWAGHGWGQHL
uniref:Reverse transcriptase n=1 Tax=Leptobrachium leishanense TaxID=445787 RepID=A0A8C5QSP0_9ANUR